MYTQLRAALESRGALTSGQFDQLLAWWQTERENDAELPAFLVRKGILSATDGARLNEALQGAIPIDAAVALLTPVVLAQCYASMPGRSAGERTEEWSRDIAPASAVPAPIGEKRFGPYRLIEQVGRGPRASVFRAEDTRSDRTVAVKIFADNSGGRAAEEFLHQARAAGRVSHPNCLPILESGWEGKVAYIATPFARAGSAADALLRRGPVPLAQTVRICHLAAKGLAAAHAADVPHGNIKSSNILLGDDGDVWLADFGPRAPAGAHAAAFAADLRAFAAVMTQLLTGAPTVSAGSSRLPAPFAQLIAALLADPPAPPCADAASLAEALAAAEANVNATVTAPLGGAAPPAPVKPEGRLIVRPSKRPASPRDPAIGESLGKCLLIARIGQGGSGVVYRAEHEALGITVAVKVLNVDIGDPEARATVRKGLRREAKLLARLNHPNVVRLWEYDESHVPPYLVMEFVEGPTLADLIPSDSGMPVHQALRLMDQVASGLAAAHELGIVHRDVKPANILVAPDGRAKLTDLGLAYMANTRLSTLARPQAGAGMMAGTVAYVAPEQAIASPTADHRADIYSLGATFFHLVTGQPPFPGRTIAETLEKHAKESPPEPHKVAPHVPRVVSRVILQMLAKDPKDRPQTYEQLCSDLGFLRDTIDSRLRPTEPFIEIPSIPPPPPPPAPPPPSAPPAETPSPAPSGFLIRLRSLFGRRPGR